MARRFDTSPFHLTNDEDIRLLGRAVAAVYFHDQATDEDKAQARDVIRRVLIDEADVFKRQFDEFSDTHQRLTGRPTPQSKTNNYKKRELTDKPTILRQALHDLGVPELIALAGASPALPQPTHRGGSDQAPAHQAAYNTPDPAEDLRLTDIADLESMIIGLSEVIDGFGRQHDERQEDIEELRQIIEEIEAAMRAEKARSDDLSARIDALEAKARPQPSAAVISLRERIRANHAKEHELTPEVLRQQFVHA